MLLCAFSFLRKALDSISEYSVPNEQCELCLPWETAPHRAASPAVLQDVTEDTRREKHDQHKKRRINHSTAITYYPGERWLGRKLGCYRSPFRRSEPMGMIGNLSPIYI